MARLNSPNADASDEEFVINPLKTKLDVLWLFVPLMSTVSIASVAVSVSTSGWLHTTERMLNPTYNGTGTMENEYLFKKTVSGLWSYCYTNL
ncbi:hypothetical protein GWI33_020787 [Rhynchophorus ferrugineus]|uniref:Uncharacterized protein n=1 Tax=Rhynchophorus ferrugineus TaxID=354439 RepID=A0A834HPV0_RHYFE|nr:hypothetical protein GWI33_020787 [Rhynchophorus ferrugineus]